jgi:hypothetical protein
MEPVFLLHLETLDVNEIAHKGLGKIKVILPTTSYV